MTSDGGDSYNPNSYLVPSSPHFMIRQHLSEIFLSVLKSSINGPHIDCTFKKTWTDNPAEVRGTFVVEASVNANLLVLLTTDVKNDLELFELTSPSGQKYAFPKYDYASVYFQVVLMFTILGPFIHFILLVSYSSLKNRLTRLEYGATTSNLVQSL